MSAAWEPLACWSPLLLCLSASVMCPGSLHCVSPGKSDRLQLVTSLECLSLHINLIPKEYPASLSEMLFIFIFVLFYYFFFQLKGSLRLQLLPSRLSQRLPGLAVFVPAQVFFALPKAPAEQKAQSCAPEPTRKPRPGLVPRRIWCCQAARGAVRGGKPAAPGAANPAPGGLGDVRVWQGSSLSPLGQRSRVPFGFLSPQPLHHLAAGRAPVSSHHAGGSQRRESPARAARVLPERQRRDGAGRAGPSPWH